MVNINVSERNSNNMSVAYIYNSMTKYLNICKANADITFDDTRTNLIISTDKSYSAYIRKFTEEQIADVIAIGYKYAFFKNNVFTSGLSENDREILLCGIVSADFNEDKKYITDKLNGVKIYAIDGFFNFRLKALKNKWTKIIECIPQRFTDRDLIEFLNYLVKEREKIIVRYKNGALFDNNYNRLKRASLIGDSFDKLSLIKEIILSCATEIICHNNPPIEFVEMIKKYYSGKIIFN